MNYEGSIDLKVFTSEDKAKQLVKDLLDFKNRRPILPEFTSDLSQEQIIYIDKVLTEWEIMSPLPNEPRIGYYDDFNYKTLEVE